MSDIEKLKEISTKLTINYSEMKDSILNILETNGSYIDKRIKLYNNFFLTGIENDSYNKKKKYYNTYFSIFKFIDINCNINDDVLSLYDSGKNNIKTFINQEINVEKIYEQKEELETNQELNNIYLKLNSNIKCKPITNVFKSISKYPFSIKYALFIKIIAKYCNKNIGNIHLTNINLPYLTILDLDESITEDDKEIILNLINLSLILKYKYKYYNFYTNLEELPYYKNYKQFIRNIEMKVNKIIEKVSNLFKQLKINVNIGYTNAASNLLIGQNRGKLNIIYALTGNTDFADSKNFFKKYENFEGDIFDINFNFNTMDKLYRDTLPILFSCDDYLYGNKTIDSFFEKILGKSINLFDSILKTKNLDERNDLIMKLLNIDKNNLTLKENFQIYKKTVKISTTKKEELEKIFHKSEIENECPKIRNNYESVLNVSKQFYDNAINITSFTPYFANYPINIDNQGSETGFTTGPSKQIMYNLSNLLNYIIRFDNDKNKIEFIKPVWANNDLNFYTFLTHYLLVDLSLEISKINFNLNFKMLIPIFIDMYDKNYKLFNDKSIFLNIISEFNNFVNISNVEDLFFENDKPKYDNLPKEYIIFYNKICLFLIADLIDGGNEFKLLKEKETRDFILDPDAEFLETKLESYKMPDGFLDFNSFKIFYPNVSDSELYTLIQNKLFKIYFIINEDKSFTSEDIINKITFINESGDKKYDSLNDYLKKIITDYSKNLPDQLVKTIKEIYPNQESFNKKVLLAWTASVNLTDSTELKFIVTSNVGQLMRIYTCFNTIYYPSPIEVEYSDEIKYEDFANIFLQAINDVGFGLTGGRRTKKRKSKILNKKNLKKKSKKLILKNLLEKKNKKYKKSNKLISKYKKKSKKIKK